MYRICARKKYLVSCLNPVMSHKQKTQQHNHREKEKDPERQVITEKKTQNHGQAQWTRSPHPTAMTSLEFLSVMKLSAMVFRICPKS